MTQNDWTNLLLLPPKQFMYWLRGRELPEEIKAKLLGKYLKDRREVES